MAQLVGAPGGARDDENAPCQGVATGRMHAPGVGCGVGGLGFGVCGVGCGVGCLGCGV